MYREFPDQRVSDSDKFKESWYKDCYDYLIERAISDNDKVRTNISLNAADGIVDMSTFKYALEPFQSDDPAIGSLPGVIRDVDFIRPIRDKSIGEYIELPYRFTITVENAEIVLERDYKLKKELETKIIAIFKETVKNNGQQPQFDFSAFREEFINSWQRDEAIKAQHTLNLINKLTDFELRRIQGFYFWWCTNEFYTYRTIRNGELIVELVPPTEGYPIENNSDFVEDYDGFVRVQPMTLNQILDNTVLRENMDDKTYKYLNEFVRKSVTEAGAIVPLNEAKDFLGADRFNNEHGNTLINDRYNFCNSKYINVYHIQWKTQTEVKILTYRDIDGQINETVVPSNYKLNKQLGDVSIKTEWNNKVIEGYRIGSKEVGVYIKPEYSLVQRQEVNNLSTCKLSYGGKKGVIKGMEIDPIPYRLISYLATYKFYNLQIERTVAKFKGSITTIPLSALQSNKISAKETYFYMMADNTFVFDDAKISPQEMAQAFRVVGNDGLGEYLKTLDFLKQSVKADAWELANMNDARYGNMQASMGKAVAEQSISAAKVGSILGIIMFHEALRREHQADLDYSKYAWIDGYKGSYFDNDGNPVNVVVDGELHLKNNYGVFVANSVKELKELEALKNYAFNLSQNGDKSLAFEAITNQSIPELKKYVTKFDEATKAFQESQNKQKNDAIIQAEQIKAETANADRMSNERIALMKEEYALERERIKSDTSILSLESNTNNQEDNSKMINELSKDRINQQKLNNEFNRDSYTKVKDAMDYNLKIKEIESKERIAKENKNKYDK